jgi:hypothetical protein
MERPAALPAMPIDWINTSNSPKGKYFCSFGNINSIQAASRLFGTSE